MRKRILSALLTLCIVLTLLPATALAAENTSGPFQVNSESYGTLANAVSAAGENGTVEVVGTYSLQSGDSFGSIASIIIAEGGSLGVPVESASGLLGYSGSIVVEAGGELELPNSSFQLEPWFGGADARMHIQEGSITLTGFPAVDNGGVQWILR